MSTFRIFREKFIYEKNYDAMSLIYISYMKLEIIMTFNKKNYLSIYIFEINNTFKYYLSITLSFKNKVMGICFGK